LSSQWLQSLFYLDPGYYLRRILAGSYLDGWGFSQESTLPEKAIQPHDQNVTLIYRASSCFEASFSNLSLFLLQLHILPFETSAILALLETPDLTIRKPLQSLIKTAKT
jgi:hypothetical protein